VSLCVSVYVAQLSPHTLGLVRLLHRRFCQQVRFGSSTHLNRGKCEGFLCQYGLAGGSAGGGGTVPEPVLGMLLEVRPTPRPPLPLPLRLHAHL
jgi:hypothetical protein